MKEINMVRKPEMVKLVSQISGVTQEKTQAVLDGIFYLCKPNQWAGR